MSPVITREPPPARLRARPLILAAAAAAVVLAAAALIFAGVGGPGFADRLTVRNPTARPIDVEVGRPGSDKSLPLGVVAPDDSRAFEHVVDQGDEWQLRFFDAGASAGELTLTKDELKSREWQVEVPRGEISP